MWESILGLPQNTYLTDKRGVTEDTHKDLHMKKISYHLVFWGSLLGFCGIAQAQTVFSLVQTSKELVLSNETGISLYTFDNDIASGVSTCYDGCARVWPPQLTELDTIAAPFGISARTDGTKQLTLYGLPVYRYAPDKVSGDVKGDNVGEVWHLARILPQPVN